MNEQQKRIAEEAIAEIVRDAVSGREVPTGQQLKELAENAAKAIAAGFSALDGAS